MKYLKILGLAAVAALALMAFVGAGTASAETTLCTAAEPACQAANMDGPGTGAGMEKMKSILKAGTEAVLKAPFGSVKCKGSKVAGNIETTTTPEGKVAELTFTECNCPVTVLKPGTLQVHAEEIAGEVVGNVTVKEFEVKVGGANINCFLINNFECIYGGEILTGLTLKGGNPAFLVAKASIKWVGGSTGKFTCGDPDEWKAEYEVVEPKPLFVSKGL